MSREVAQPSQSKDKEKRLDRTGGPDHLQSAPSPRQPVGENRKIASWKVNFIKKDLMSVVLHGNLIKD